MFSIHPEYSIDDNLQDKSCNYSYLLRFVPKRKQLIIYFIILK